MRHRYEKIFGKEIIKMSSEKNIFSSAAAHIPIKLLDVMIIVGILAMALLIPFLSAKGGFTITFDSMGGTSVSSQRLRYGDSVDEPEAPTREDYVFDGWYYDSEGKHRFDFENAQADKSLTLFALWSKAE